MRSPISLRTPLDTLENSSLFPPRVPCCFTASLPRSPSRLIRTEKRECAHTHAHTPTQIFCESAFSLQSFPANFILSKSRALNTHSPPLRITGDGVTCLTPFVTTLFVYVSLCEGRRGMNRAARVASGGNQRNSCLGICKGVQMCAMILYVSDKHADVTKTYYSREREYIYISRPFHHEINIYHRHTHIRMSLLINYNSS